MTNTAWMGQHEVRCRRTGEGIGIKLDGGWCVCKSSEQCRLLERPAGHPAGLERELAALLNKASRESASNTPDFILAEYMMACLRAFELASRAREMWFGKELRIGDRSGDDAVLHPSGTV